jgi:hypothetical protein
MYEYSEVRVCIEARAAEMCTRFVDLHKITNVSTASLATVLIALLNRSTDQILKSISFRPRYQIESYSNKRAILNGSIVMTT